MSICSSTDDVETKASDISLVNDFRVPIKLIKKPSDLAIWKDSQAYQDYIGFIKAMGHSIQGCKITDIDVTSEISKSIEKILDLLAKLLQWVDDIAPVDTQHQRFGNVSFRTWNQRLFDQSDELLSPLLSSSKAAIPEVAKYLTASFGDSTRIDYGTGHEMAFLMFLACLFKIHVFQPQEIKEVGLVVFDRYMRLVRKLQKTYRMEPAGSHGVWNLDDYQFVSFILGAAQLYRHPEISPLSIPDYDLAERLSDQYHFFGCINYISKVKKGNFGEHSNQLWNISSVASWAKVQSGLIKMYEAEVLSKFPVMQHTYFGSLFTLTSAKASFTSHVS